LENAGERDGWIKRVGGGGEVMEISVRGEVPTVWTLEIRLWRKRDTLSGHVFLERRNANEPLRREFHRVDRVMRHLSVSTRPLPSVSLCFSSSHFAIWEVTRGSPPPPPPRSGGGGGGAVCSAGRARRDGVSVMADGVC